MTKKLFIETISFLEERSKFQEDLQSLLDKELEEGFNFIYPYTKWENMLVKILEEELEVEFEDRTRTDWISYFIYELEFGKKWEPGMITDVDGSDIDLSTSEKLYDFLISENDSNPPDDWDMK